MSNLRMVARYYHSIWISFRGSGQFNDEFVLPLLDRIFVRGDTIQGTVFEQIDFTRALTDRKLGIEYELQGIILNLLIMQTGVALKVIIVDEPEDVSLVKAFDFSEEKEIIGKLEAAFRIRLELNINPEENIYGVIQGVKNNLVLTTTRYRPEVRLIEYIFNGRVNTEIAFSYNREAGKIDMLNVIQLGFFKNQRLV